MAYLDEQTQRINEMYDNMKKQKLGELLGQKDQSVTDLRRQLSDQLPAYQTARAQADVSEAQDLNKLKEYMASFGAFNSGDNLSRASNVLTQRSNAVNQINGNENAFTTSINNKVNDVNTSYNNNVNSVGTDVDNQKMQAIEALREKLRQEELQRQQLAEQRAYEEAQAEKAYQRQLALSAKSKSSSSGAKSSSSSQKTADTNAVWNELYKAIDNRNAEGFLQTNRDPIISNLGSAEYQKLLKYAKDYTYSAAENKQYTQRTNNRQPMTYTGD